MNSLQEHRSPEELAPSCTVVIPTCNRPIQLEKCLEAVARLHYPRFDVCVVDNAPQDGRIPEIVARWGFRYIIEPIPGVSRARNRAARSSDSEIIALLDDDCVPEPAWLRQLVEEFRDPLVIAVTGRILPFKVMTEAERIYILLGGYSFAEERRVIDLHTPSWFELTNFGGVCGAGNMAIRRAAFDLYQGFDERIGAGMVLEGCADYRALFLLVERGHRIVSTPNATVYHPCPKTMEDLRRAHLRTIAASAGYLTLLFCEHHRYRKAILQFLVGWARGVPRPWRRKMAGSPPQIVPRWRTILACLKGPLLYARALVAYRLSSDKSQTWSK